MRWPNRLLSAVILSSMIPLTCSQAAADKARAGSATSSAAGSVPAPGAAAAAGPPKVLRPPQFFKEEWKQTDKGGEHPVAADSLSNPNLELKLYVPAGEIVLTGNAGDENNPIHVWMGLCTSPCAAAFRDKKSFADLTGLARIRWNTKVSGFHQVRPIVKLADGTWLVGDHADGTARDWLISEISFADLRWLELDIERVVTTGVFREKVDLSRVEEIGFADLMPGSGHGPGGWSDVAQVEVFGKPVSR
ncbi:MAG: hypothetical protein WDO56_29035 [Gammaproteobacteria bacterium]